MTEQKHIEALKIVQMLISLGHPKDSTDLHEWSKKLKCLQSLLAKCWESDPSGKLMVVSLHLLYVCIADDLTPVGPAAWSILDLVEEEKIYEFVEGILSHPDKNDDTKIKNMLIAMIDGLGQIGFYAKKLQDWILAIVRGLETRKNYSVLTEVSEKVIKKLMQLLMIPLYQPIIYPTFRQFLYPVVTPDVFYKIINDVPGALNKLYHDFDCDEDKSIRTDFAGLIQSLIDRFPPKPHLEAKYNLIKIALMKFPEKTFDPDSLILWDPKESISSSNYVIQNINTSQDNTAQKIPYKGLMNQGNTCFMNSVLQILYMTTRFRYEVLTKEFDLSEKSAIDLQQLFAFMQESNRTVLVPNGVIDSTLPPTFRRGHQQDSSEYLIYLLDILHENEVKVTQSKKPRKQEGNGDFDENETSKKIEENTIVERLFGGVTMSTTICSFCKKSFPKNEHFRNLHLPIPDDYNSYDLQDLINASLEPEELSEENMYDCENCGTKRNATRTHAIVKAPEHLILTLKLFRFDSVKKQRLKLHSRLKNVLTVELPVFHPVRTQPYVVSYDLKGAILHSGSSLDGGHYFCSAVDQTGLWYTFNDSIVSSNKYEFRYGGGTPYVLILRQHNLGDPPLTPLPSNLQLIVNKDNQKFLTEKRFQQKSHERRKDYDDDTPPNSGSLGGPSLVF